MKFKHLSYSEFQNTQKHPLKYFTEILIKTINVT